MSTPFFCPATRTLSTALPSPSLALQDPNGLLAVGGTLSPEHLLAAYRKGVFPWYSEGQPILWWSPDPRTVIWPAQLHISRSLRRSLQRHRWRITVNHAFSTVITRCAAPRKGASGTWLSSDMMAAYTALHRLGHAHSIECWRDDILAGGIYGIAVASVFCGESMFSALPDGSKVAILALCRRLVRWGYRLLDCQVENPHLNTLGASPLSRATFCGILRTADNVPESAWYEDLEEDVPV